MPPPDLTSKRIEKMEGELRALSESNTRQETTLEQVKQTVQKVDRIITGGDKPNEGMATQLAVLSTQLEALNKQLGNSSKLKTSLFVTVISAMVAVVIQGIAKLIRF